MHFCLTVIFIIMFQSFGWWHAYKYSPPTSHVFWAALFIVLIFFLMAIFASYLTYQEKYRDWLFFNYGGVPKDIRNDVGPVIRRNIETLLLSYDQNIEWRNDIKVGFYHPSRSDGWILKDSLLFIAFTEGFYGGSVVLWPNYVKNADVIKEEILHSIKQTIDGYLMEKR